MKPGQIQVDDVSRRYLVYPREGRTLKELVVRRGRGKPSEVWALRGVSFDVEPGSALALVGRNGSGKSTLLKILSEIIRPTTGHAEAGGRVASLLELGAGFHPDFTGRENVYLNASIHGLRRTYVREQMDEIVAFAGLKEFIDLPVRTYSSGMVMRLGFSVASHIDADVLLLDEVFAVGDEAFQRKCFGKIFEFKRGGGTIVFVSHDAASVERLCERAVLLRGGSVEFDGPSHEAIIAYHRLLADERDPEERGAGLKEWGSGEARIASVQLLGPDGDERKQFLSGEPLTLRLEIETDGRVASPVLRYELRDDANVLLAAGAQPTEGAGTLRFDVDELPLADGRFALRFGLADPTGEHVYHQLDEALTFVVYPSGDERGLLRLDGVWSREETAARAEIGER